MTEFLLSGDADAETAVLLAHGAGAPMDSPFMEAFAALLAERGCRVARFEFAYMAARRSEGGRRPPPRAELLTGEYERAVAELDAVRRLVIGGKSLGGRVASLAAQTLFDARAIAGLLCLGYPFHPPGRSDRLRTAHLEPLTIPALICQGVRDPLGSREEVEAYALPASIRLHWATDGDHDLVPRKRSGLTAEDNWRAAAAAIAKWLAELPFPPDLAPTRKGQPSF